MKIHKLSFLRKFGRKLLWTLCVSLLLCTSSTNALSNDQLNIYSQGINYFDLVAGSACGNVTIPAGTLPSVIPEPYNGAFTSAGKAYNVSPVLLASLFTEENFTSTPTSGLAQHWKDLPTYRPDPNSGWPTSPDGAMGPFQFIPSTWASLGVDANHDGKADVENLLDASYGAANYAKTDGATADAPKAVWVSFAAGYSGHTNGYDQQVSQYIDFYASGGTASTSATSSAPSTDSCAPGAVQNNIVATALNFAWEDYPNGHTATSSGEAAAKPAYVAALKQYLTEAGSDPSGYTTNYTDCGAFVATVMRASGIDPKYWPERTSQQLTYVQGNTALYTVKAPGTWSISDVQPGDIFISDGHTYIYVGKQSNGYSVAEASQSDHVPEVDALPYTSQTVGGNFEQFYLVRVNR